MPDYSTLTSSEQLATARQFISDLPGDLGNQRVAPVYMDGVPVEVLRDAVNATDFTAGARQSTSARFWATPPRAQAVDPTRDVFEVDLSSARLVNKIAFDVAHFPHRAVVEYSTTTNGAWLPLLDDQGQQIIIETVESNPPVLSQQASQNLVHPQHYGAGHWLTQEFKTQPVSPVRVRVILTRPLGGTPPVDTQGNLIPYSLGIRSFVVGYEVDGRRDIPVRPLLPLSLTTHRPIETTRDLLGSTVAYSERENPAVNLLAGRVWRSGPQPVPYAVVNLYVDVRDGANSATVVERFFIDPVTSGCAMNLYYTRQVPNLTAADPWAYVEWTPVGRDFACRRGYLRLDPTRATFFKFEFTDLTPEPYDGTQAVVRTVKLFPAGLESTDPITRSGNTGGPGALVNGALDGTLRYSDNDRFVADNLTDLSRGYSPTEVFYSKDPNAAARLRDLSPFYNYLPWQGGTQAPHWPGTQVHDYIEAEVLHDQRVAFYVALSNVTAYRLDYGFTEDTDQYLEYFFDQVNLASNTGWLVTSEDAVTPATGGGPWRITSKILPSRSNVRGVQFATTQSPPAQLLPDDDFDSARISPSALAQFWRAFGVGETTPVFASSSDYDTDIGTTVLITRQGTAETPPTQPADATYTGIGLRYSTYGNIQSQGLTYADLGPQANAIQDARVGGIISVLPVDPATGSRLYAAARVISKIGLTNPLWVQIYDKAHDKVVAEAKASVPANKIVEWSVSYDVGAANALDRKTWSEVVTSHPTWSAMDGETYSALGSKSGTVGSQQLHVRLVQKGTPNASWVVDTLSLFEESILWEFSNDAGVSWYAAPGIRNNPHGALVFPEPADTKPFMSYADIVGRDPSPLLPTYSQLGPKYRDLEYAQRNSPPDRTKLRWRVTCARPGQHVNALSVRPWYVNTGRGILAHEGVNVAGPNQALYDHYQPIALDPRFRVWDKPIPLSWYFFFRQFALVGRDGYVPVATFPVTALNQSFVLARTPYSGQVEALPDALVVPVGGPTPFEEPPSPVADLPEALIYPTAP